jgi:hypothetical protein
MSTVTVADIPLDAESPAQRLRRIAAAVRVRLRWWGVHRALTAQQKEEMGAVASAHARLLTAGKKLIDSRHEAVRRLASVRTRLGNCWRGLTLPYTEAGIRLIRQADIEPFVHAMEGSDQVNEVPLVHSTATGPPMLLHIDRRLLHRAVALGFRELEAVDADTPVVVRDRRRTFLWVPLDKKNAIPPGADVIRVGPADGIAAPPPTPPITPKEMDMPPPPNNGPPPDNRVRDSPIEK